MSIFTQIPLQPLQTVFSWCFTKFQKLLFRFYLLKKKKKQNKTNQNSGINSSTDEANYRPGLCVKHLDLRLWSHPSSRCWRCTFWEILNRCIACFLLLTTVRKSMNSSWEMGCSISIICLGEKVNKVTLTSLNIYIQHMLFLTYDKIKFRNSQTLRPLQEVLRNYYLRKLVCSLIYNSFTINHFREFRGF